MHDVTKSSNPDVLALVAMNRQLGATLLRLIDELAALRAEVAAIPDQFVVPNDKGEIVIAGRVVKPGTPLKLVQDTALAKFESLRAGVDAKLDEIAKAG